MRNRTRLFSCITLVSLLFPIVVSARPISEIVNPSLQTVSRSNFLTWSFEALSIPKTNANCTLPFTKFPRGLKSVLCAALDQGALDAFPSGNGYTLGKNITHGEAIQVVTALLNKQENANVSAFKDVKTPAEKQAVMNAIALKWMTPIKSNLFGLSRPLTGSEALTLLSAAAPGSSTKMQTITITLPSQQGQSTVPKSDLLEAVWQLINRDYLRKDKIDATEAGYKAIEALVDSLKDPYSNFFRPASASDFQSQIKGELSGIGANIEDIDGVITVVSPLPGSPAEKAGIQAKDQILEANGVSLSGIGVEKAVNHIRGEVGTSVTLKIRRNGTEITFTIVRNLISIPEIQVKWQGDIAVVQLAQFGETTDKQIRTVFANIAKQNPRGIILDLRNNGGGLLTAADAVVSNFVPKGTVVAKVEGKNETTLEKTQDEATIDSGIKLVVLINKGSASASEIVAGALQDHKRATIIGVQSFGKGTVQEVISFRSSEALKLTIAEWLTPLGRKLDNLGVKPDIIVEKDGTRDDQLQRALEILR
ncbi:S41 family peptidase [Candidatus Peribacteria bacterium]|nr:S41 family peptidase [Candidatus Peribacteria bacterium]